MADSACECVCKCDMFVCLGVAHETGGAHVFQHHLQLVVGLAERAARGHQVVDGHPVARQGE